MADLFGYGTDGRNPGMKQGLFSEQLVIGTVVEDQIPDDWRTALSTESRKRRNEEFPSLPDGCLVFTPGIDEDAHGVYSRATQRVMWNVSRLKPAYLEQVQLAGADKLGIIGTAERTTFARSGPCNLRNTGPDSLLPGQSIYWCTRQEFKMAVTKNQLFEYQNFLRDYYDKGCDWGDWEEEDGPAILLTRAQIDEMTDLADVKRTRFVGRVLVGARRGRYINARLRQYA